MDRDSAMWPELLPDVLREISSRLHHVDFVHFHAVCKPWRASHQPTTTRTARTQSVLPWLLASDKKTSLKLRCVFSRTSYRAVPPFRVRRREWVASADGTGTVCCFADRPSPSLRDLLTGAVTLLLPPLPRYNGSSPGGGGVVCRDRTVLLYSTSVHGDTTKLTAALLRPGDAAWTVVDRTFRSPDLNVSYHRGKILVTVGGDPALTPNDEVGVGDVLAVPRPWMPCEVYHYFYKHHYVLESRGELLCVSIYVSQEYPHAFGGKANVAGLVRALSVSVHALEKEEDDQSTPGKMHWVCRDGGSLADRVLFLGWPNSFAVDASRLTGDAVGGGCAYFVYRDAGVTPNRPCYVLRYNLVDGQAKFVERLPEGWNNDKYMWLFPQPSIAPTQDLAIQNLRITVSQVSKFSKPFRVKQERKIRELLDSLSNLTEIIDQLEGRKCWWKKKPYTSGSNIYMEIPQPQCCNTNLRVSVRNLPPKVDSFQLQQFFGKHGKVSNAKVGCKRRNRMSKKIGLVTIAMVEERVYALAALNGLVFNGCTLEVRLAQRWKERHVPPARSNQHSRGYLICIVLLLCLFVLISVWWKLM